MKDEDKIYGLIAAAEEIQRHAQGVQAEQERIFAQCVARLQKQLDENLPRAMSTATDAIRRAETKAIAWGAAAFLAVGAVLIMLVWAQSHLVLFGLRSDARELRAEIARLQEELALAEKTVTGMKTWGLQLQEWEEEGRGIILPEGVRYRKTLHMQDGSRREVLMLTDKTRR